MGKQGVGGGGRASAMASKKKMMCYRRARLPFDRLDSRSPIRVSLPNSLASASRSTTDEKLQGWRPRMPFHLIKKASMRGRSPQVSGRVTLSCVAFPWHDFDEPIYTSYFSIGSSSGRRRFAAPRRESHRMCMCCPRAFHSETCR